MAYTYNRTGFVNGRTYDEKEHSVDLSSIVNHVTTNKFEKFDIVGTNIKSGAGLNNGLPFELGRLGETENVAAYTGYLIVHSKLNGLVGITELMRSASVPPNTATDKYFAIYKLKNGAVEEDLRNILDLSLYAKIEWVEEIFLKKNQIGQKYVMLWEGANFMNKGQSINLPVSNIQTYHNGLIYCFVNFKDGVVIPGNRKQFMVIDANDGGEELGPDGFYDSNTFLMSQNEYLNTDPITNAELCIKSVNFQADGLLYGNTDDKGTNNAHVLRAVFAIVPEGEEGI